MEKQQNFNDSAKFKADVVDMTAEADVVDMNRLLLEFCLNTEEQNG